MINMFLNLYILKRKKYPNIAQVVKAGILLLKFYSGKKNKQLIELINDQKEQWRFSIRIKKVLSVVTTSLLVPIVTLIYKWLFDNVKPIDQIIIYVGLIITTILVILGISFMIVPLFINKIDKEYKEFNRL